jgi:hypothetical protein
MNARMPDSRRLKMRTPTTQQQAQIVSSASISASAKESVGFWRSNANISATDHDMSTKSDVARSIAALLGNRFDGDLTDAKLAQLSILPGTSTGGVYWVPSGTLSAEAAARLGIRGPDDFFGGVVPFPFIASKVITHPLFAPDAAAPEGWTHEFGHAIRDAVLPGFSVFTRSDALAAGTQMLDQGAVRIKQADGVGGNGQSVATSAAELREQLDALDEGDIQREGLVLELNLEHVITYSVGRVQVGPWLASYVGTQRLTSNHRGDEVYGGSDLMVVRGDFDDLLSMSLTAAEHTAVEHALIYHRLAMKFYPGLFASRCNYDVVIGNDASGAEHCGVLEQSWRIGGASAAEIAALIALRDDPSIDAVRAETNELYSADVVVPFGSLIHFDGKDSHGGPLIKYALVSPYLKPDPVKPDPFDPSSQKEDLCQPSTNTSTSRSATTASRER